MLPPDSTLRRRPCAGYLAANNIPWPLLESGHLDLSDDAFRQQARAYPAVSPASTQERARQVDLRRHRWQQTLERFNVALAIIEDRLALFIVPRPTAQDQRPHVLFLSGTHAVEAKVREGAEQTVARRCVSAGLLSLR
jgi:hypothetical protein